MTLSATKITTHIRINQLNYHEKRNLSGLMAAASTSSMQLPLHRELMLKTVRQLDRDIINATEDQSRHKIRVNVVDISRYRQERGMELLQEEILYGGDNTHLVWTPRLQLCPAALAEVRAKGEKLAASIRITVTSKEENHLIIKYSIWFGGERHRDNDFVEISTDTLCSTCCHWDHITLQCLNADRSKCQLCAELYMTTNHKCKMLGCTARMGKG